MALSVVNGISALANNAHVVTTTGISITAGNLIVVGTSNFDTDGLNNDVSVTDSVGNTYTKIGSSAEVGTRHVSIWYAKNVIGGASVTFTYNVTVANSDFPRIDVVQVAGADTASPLDAGSSASFTTSTTAGTTLTSPSITTALANEILFAMGGDSGTTGTESFADGGCTNNSGAWTVAQSNISGSGMQDALAYAIVSSTGTFCVTQTCSVSQNSRMLGIVSFKAATSAPPVATNRWLG